MSVENHGHLHTAYRNCYVIRTTYDHCSYHLFLEEFGVTRSMSVRLKLNYVFPRVGKLYRDVGIAINQNKLEVGSFSESLSEVCEI